MPEEALKRFPSAVRAMAYILDLKLSKLAIERIEKDIKAALDGKRGMATSNITKTCILPKKDDIANKYSKA